VAPLADPALARRPPRARRKHAPAANTPRPRRAAAPASPPLCPEQAAVKEARAELAAGRPVPGILGGLVTAVDEDGGRLTDPEITDNLVLLMLAGHDTSSTTLTNAMTCIQVGRRV
jgi:cytochrome P450